MKSKVMEINHTKQSLSCEADVCSAGQEIHRTLWTQKFISFYTRSLHLSLPWQDLLTVYPLQSSYSDQYQRQLFF